MPPMERNTLIAFTLTIAAIVVLVLAGVFASRNSFEVLGIGAAVTGLIGVLGTFRPHTQGSGTQDVNVKNTSDNPVPTENTDEATR